MNEKMIEAAAIALAKLDGADLTTLSGVTRLPLDNWRAWSPQAKVAISAALDAALGKTEGTELTDPEIAMQEAAWKALPNGVDITINDYNRAVRAGYRAALQALKGQTP
jgi:hypothetical protein